MKDVLAFTAGLLIVASAFPYIIDIAKSKTHPNLVTWITWTLVGGISTLAAISDHATHTAILSGAMTFGNAMILFMGLGKGVKKYTRFDFICQSLALLGLALWIQTGDPSLAVIFSICAVLIAALPTWRHAWLKPFEETWQGFAIAVLAGTLTIFSLNYFTFIALAYPIVTIFNSSVVVSIILRRRQSSI